MTRKKSCSATPSFQNTIVRNGPKATVGYTPKSGRKKEKGTASTTGEVYPIGGRPLP
jgi:hypothetical protein